MKDQLLVHGGIRHIIGWFGLAYVVIFFMHLFGMFPSFFEAEGVFQIGAPTFVGFVFALLYEWYLDFKKSTSALIENSSASFPDVFCSAFGVLMAAVIAYFNGDSWWLFVLSIGFIYAAWYDRRKDAVRKLFL